MSSHDTDPLPFLEPRLIASEREQARPGDRLELAASRCAACDRVDFPRRATCSSCSGPTTAARLSGGTLERSTSVLHPPPGAQVETPYHLGVAAFAEGISVLGQLLVGSLDEVHLGDDLEVVATEVDGTVTYGFRPT